MAEGQQNILRQAEQLVYGCRGEDYGHPADDHGRVAGAVSALLAHKLKQPLTALDVEIIMVVIKLSRLAHKYKRDSVVDIAGYAATMELSADSLARARKKMVVVRVPPGETTDGLVRCPYCDGTGGGAKRCRSCNGTGRVPYAGA